MKIEEVIETLNRLHNSNNMKWREIANLKEFKGIPAGTLCSIAKGKHIPKKNKYRRILGLPEIISREAYRNDKGRFTKFS